VRRQLKAVDARLVRGAALKLAGHAHAESLIAYQSQGQDIDAIYLPV
jgi:predicted Zn-dependent protease